MYLDLDRTVHVGLDDASTIETAVRVAASVSGRALDQGRAVGLEAYGTAAGGAARGPGYPAAAEGAPPAGGRRRRRWRHRCGRCSSMAWAGCVGARPRSSSRPRSTRTGCGPWQGSGRGAWQPSRASSIPLAHDAQTRLVAATCRRWAPRAVTTWARDMPGLLPCAGRAGHPDGAHRSGAAAGGPDGRGARPRPGRESHDRRDRCAARESAACSPGRVAGRAACQGWGSLLLLLVMLAVTGLAIDEQRWMGTGPDGASADRHAAPA